jgi:AcrR family transcriptional regulator
MSIMRVKTEDRRQAIMQAALSVFGEVGYDRASMSEIATRLGYSKATLYGYFPSKEELFATALLENHSDEAEKFLDILDIARTDVPEVLMEFGRAFLAFETSPALIDSKRNALAQGAASSLGPIIHDRGPKYACERIRAYLAALMDRGDLRREDAAIAALHLKGLLEAGIVEAGLYGAPPPLSIDRATTLAVAAFLRAYGPEPAP